MNTQEVIYSAVTTDTINCFCGIIARMGEAVRAVPVDSTTTTTMANGLNAAGTLIGEIFADFIGALLN